MVASNMSNQYRKQAAYGMSDVCQMRVAREVISKPVIPAQAGIFAEFNKEVMRYFLVGHG
jgi:hypothetical protein